MAFNGESSEEGGRCLSFGALCERLDAIEETHGRVQARKARGDYSCVVFLDFVKYSVE